MPGTTNRFAVFAQDSDEEGDMKVVEAKKQPAKKDVKPVDDTKQTYGTRKYEEGDYNNDGAKPYRGRGGRGARGDGYRGRGRGDGYRGRGRGDGYRGGRYRGNYEGGEHARPRDTYSRLASKQDVVGDQEQQPSGYGERKRQPRHEGYDKHSGTGYGREYRKGGAGGWGNPNEERKYERQVAEAVTEEPTEEQPHKEEVKEEKVEETPAVEEQKVEEEEEPTGMTYAEYLEEKKRQQQNLKKATARKPEELNVKNIEKYEKDERHKKPGLTHAKKHESHTISGLADSEVALGFQPVGEEQEEDSFRPRRGDGRGRGRGGRGRGGRGQRGGFRGDENQGHYEKRRENKKFVSTDNDFPAL